jgi:gamma-glutamyltranspeptidase / glutathione hydrolase
MEMANDSAQNLRAESYAYPSRRMPIVASRGVVATSEPLAAQAGLSILQRGGNAVDAAIATAIALTVVEPTSNGIGSDAFAIVWDGNKLHGLNGSGRAPATHTVELFEKQGLDFVPNRGWLPVTVPGAPATWADLHKRFGKLPFEALFEPAIRMAEDGFPLAPVVGEGWGMSARNYAQTNIGPEFAGWFSTFTKDGTPPRPGEMWQLPDHARTLRIIAQTRAEAFYEGELAKKIVEFAAETNGYLTMQDLANHTSTWVDPISTSYRGYDVWEIPPNGQGIAALAALNVLEGFDLCSIPRDSVESFHLQIEAMKLGFSDAHRYVADMTQADVPVKGMLDKEYAAQRRRLISERAMLPEAGEPPQGGTVYLCAADGDGMMISMIQSNFQGFGSGIVVPGTGIALQNRGANFRVDRNHLNCVAPGKRPYHTIIPAFLTQGGEALGPFGVMGGFMQPQGHLQMVVNQVDYGMNPQTSLDAPRWQWLKDRQVAIESAVPQHVMAGLGARGHQLEVRYQGGTFGKGQIIRRLKNGVLVAGSEPRADGCAMGW